MRDSIQNLQRAFSSQNKRSVRLSASLAAAAGLVLALFSIAPAQVVQKLPFRETFEDTAFTSRGWYDSPQIRITADQHIQGSGHACVWHWRKKGDVMPDGKGGRVLFNPVESVTLSFSMKHSADWTWTGVNWHPHEMHFMTTKDDAFWGPAYTFLTLYVEVVNGEPRMAIQDSRNIDTTQLRKDLAGVTEKRSLAGGNGDSDGYGKGDVYKAGEGWRNGKDWGAKEVYFGDKPGPHFQGDWHKVKAHIKLNSIVDGKGVRDGVLQYWYDGKLIMDYHDVMLRTGANADMKINQFLMLPYFGPGVPHEQSIWIDDLEITE
jgi:hypothetical protein